MRHGIIKKIKNAGMNPVSLAEILFPKIKFPYTALRRVLRGEGEFTATQVKLFTKTLGLTYEDFFKAYVDDSELENDPQPIETSSDLADELL